jgi:hypothetical protein
MVETGCGIDVLAQNGLLSSRWFRSEDNKVKIREMFKSIKKEEVAATTKLNERMLKEMKRLKLKGQQNYPVHRPTIEFKPWVNEDEEKIEQIDTNVISFRNTRNFLKPSRLRASWWPAKKKDERRENTEEDKLRV